VSFPADDPRSATNLPDWFIDSVQAFVQSGRIPGDFLLAVLSNDLKEAVARADHQSMRGLVAMVCYLYNEIPQMAWGSPGKVQAWIDHRGFEGPSREALVPVSENVEGQTVLTGCQCPKDYGVGLGFCDFCETGPDTTEEKRGER
jgi:hypothetical protein